MIELGEMPHPVRLPKSKAEKVWDEVGLWLATLAVLVIVAGLAVSGAVILLIERHP